VEVGDGRGIGEKSPVQPPVVAEEHDPESLVLDERHGGIGGHQARRTRVSEVLNRRRSLSIGMIRQLHEKLGISAEVLIRPTRTKSAA